MELCSGGSLEERDALLDVGLPHSDEDSDGSEWDWEWEEITDQQDQLYSHCLARALVDAAAPLTVGIFAPCSHRLQGMLQHLEASMRSISAHLRRRSALSGYPRPRSARGWGLVQALFLFALFRPIHRRPPHRIQHGGRSRHRLQDGGRPSHRLQDGGCRSHRLQDGGCRSRHQLQDGGRAAAPFPPVSFIFVRFSAWHYVGCDRLWAGLLSVLCSSIRHRFGSWLLAVYHVTGTAPRYAGTGSDGWELRPSACFKAAAICVALLLGLTLLTVALAAPWFREHRLLSGLGLAFSSASGSGLLATLYAILRRVIITERNRLERWSDRSGFETQLGFMSKVKDEVEGLSSFLAAMEVFERRRFRIVLEISALERCGPERCAGVLNAVNTLLADPKAPFVSVVAAESDAVIRCLQGAEALRGYGGNAYVYLRSCVGLMFCVPRMERTQRMREVRTAILDRNRDGDRGGGRHWDTEGHPKGP